MCCSGNSESGKCEIARVIGVMSCYWGLPHEILDYDTMYVLYSMIEEQFVSDGCDGFLDEYVEKFISSHNITYSNKWEIELV